MDFNTIGKDLPRIDAAEKATGEACYTADLQLPGMLYGKILRSPYPHALIKNIDLSRVRNLKGIHSIITAEDVSQNKFSFAQHLADKTMLCRDKVRYVGDEVAAVAAIDEDIACQAIDRIEVDYQVLPAVFDPMEAMAPGAPLLHEGESNVCFQTERTFGHPERAFHDCDYIREDDYITSQVAHCCLETSNCVARWSPSGQLTIWTGSQAPHTQRQEVARILGLPVARVRIISPTIGGGFGARLVMNMKLPLAAVLSKLTGRPVKIENSREEEFSVGKTRYPSRIHIRTGAKNDGKLWAREMKAIIDNGAYHDKGPGTIALGSIVFCTMYDVPNTKYQGCLVYTNKQMGTAFRGYGNPQVTFAMENQIDLLAADMGLDPLEFRVMNTNKPEQVTVSGAHITSCGMEECLKKAAAAAGWKKKRNRSCRRGKSGQKSLRGIGMANMVHTGGGARIYGYNASDAFVKISEDGMVSVITSAVDMGQGSHTALAQIVAQELGIGIEHVRIVSGDTDLTPYDLGAWASRTVFIHGNAVLSATRDAKAELVDAAREMMDAGSHQIVFEKGRVYVTRAEPKTACSFSDLAGYAVNKRGASISGKGRFVDKLPTGFSPAEAFAGNIPTYTFGTQVAEVEIDPETGWVNVLKVTAAHETGKTVNTNMAQGQIEGAVVQGIGYALMENMVVENGRVINDSFLDYKIPRIADIPEIETHFVETNDATGPFGAKGIGEPGIVPTAAAIANAIYNACGIQIRKLPILPQDILRGLAEKENRNG